MDDPLPVWLREVYLGYGGNSLEGPWEFQELPAVSGVRRAQLAHDLSEDAEQLIGSAAF
ncbi:MAG TPA: hypothetical protein VNO50_19605 [Pyrinomonadaceae bacterium]|nr:hypothetical protein [Pyrinomonadaceae bacterium]